MPWWFTFPYFKHGARTTDVPARIKGPPELNAMLLDLEAHHDVARTGSELAQEVLALPYVQKHVARYKDYVRGTQIRRMSSFERFFSDGVCIIELQK